MNLSRLLPRVVVLLLAAACCALRLAQAARFHPDEAFFMTFARNAAVTGDWWLTGPLDKPPLTLYLNALALHLLAVDADAGGVYFLDVYKGELAARVAGLLVGVLCVALLLALARRWLRQEGAALAAGGLLALSPFTAAFSPTAFTDMPMLLAVLAALLAAAAARRRAGWAGLWLALATAAKPQALFFLPLLVVLLWPGGWRALLRAALALAGGGAALLAWDALRPGDSVFALGAANNAPGQLLAAPADWLPRLLRWLELAQYLGGTALLTGALLLLALWRGRRGMGWLWAWAGAYSAFHIITAVNVYDRYVLLLLPALALLAGPALAELRPRWLWLPGGLLLLAAVAGAPIGGDRGAYAGIDRLAHFLNAQPVATVIYDRWLGWPLGYYLGPWTDKRRVYYPAPPALVAGALSLAEPGRRYFIAPVDVPYQPWLAALQAAGFRVQPAARIAGFRAWQLIPPAGNAESGAGAECASGCPALPAAAPP
ncbi:MAG: glycosyltransferase family 39 protein [Anaerolineae bacterium]|nr:glycosyltransferase family 39 protein [Anaerolineae bacterium]